MNKKLNGKLDTFRHEGDSRFLVARLDVCHDMENYNGSDFAREDLLRCAEETLRECPILGSVIVGDDGEKRLNGHDMDYELVETEDGYDVKVSHIEKIFGFIPHDATISTEVIDGKTHIITNCVLWSNYLDDVKDILFKQDGNCPVSMEIEILDSFDNPNGALQIKDFKFLGVTMLHECPAMEGANLQLSNFSISDVKSELKDMMKQYSLEKGGETMGEEKVVEKIEEVEVSDEIIDIAEVNDELVEEEKVVEVPVEDEIEEIKEVDEFANLKVEHEELKVECAKLERQISEMNEKYSDYEELKSFKESYDKAEYESEINSITSKFSFEEDEITELREKAIAKEISKEQYEKELYCMLGMKQLQEKENFSKLEKPTSEVKVQSNKKISPRYGELGKKYSK